MKYIDVMRQTTKSIDNAPLNNEIKIFLSLRGID